METIYTYTRAQALSDGTQVNLDNLKDCHNLRHELGIKYPVFLTSGVQQIINESLNYGCNELSGVALDILVMFRLAAKVGKSEFKVYIYWKRNTTKLFSFIAECGAFDIDNPEPAITIMLIDEC